MKVSGPRILPALTNSLSLKSLTTLALVTLSLTACGEFQGYPSLTNMTGTIQGQTYSLSSGTAEATSTGAYILTLADDPAYDCFSTPSGPYLTVVINNVYSPGQINAAGNVSFNLIETNASYSEGATSGLVSIDLVDAEGLGLIEGDMDAAGPDSEVSGAFSIPIC